MREKFLSILFETKTFASVVKEIDVILPASCKIFKLPCNAFETFCSQWEDFQII
jgi:hypothetical protein